MRPAARPLLMVCLRLRSGAPVALPALLAFLSACGSSPTLALGPDGDTGTADLVALPPDLAPPAIRLIAHEYTLEAGQETYLCKRVTLATDWLIGDITPTSAAGTHHQVLGIDPRKSAPDGVFECAGNAEFDPLSWQMLFASGVNSPTLTMPEGTAMVLRAGDQIVLQMHLLNASTRAITALAALDVHTRPAEPAPTPVQMLLAGVLPDSRVTPSIPVGSNQTVNGKCTLPAATNYFAVFPHMHQVGRHIQVTAVVGGQSRAIYDEDYRFDDQRFKQFAPLALAKGDQIEVLCTYDNQTGKPVAFGQSSYEEMCFAISFLSPPVPTKTFGDLCAQ